MHRSRFAVLVGLRDSDGNGTAGSLKRRRSRASIAPNPTGAIEGVVISGKRSRLTIVDNAGNIVTACPLVACEAEAVSLNDYHGFLQGKGHLRVMSKPLEVQHG